MLGRPEKHLHLDNDLKNAMFVRQDELKTNPGKFTHAERSLLCVIELLTQSGALFPLLGKLPGS